jgi:hypothetical protein
MAKFGFYCYDYDIGLSYDFLIRKQLKYLKKKAPGSS